GMGVLHRAGILDGVEVTAPATLARRLEAEGTTIAAPRPAWKIVPERRIASAGGAATVHPSTIALAWHLFGEHAGRELAANWDAARYGHGDQPAQELLEQGGRTELEPAGTAGPPGREGRPGAAGPTGRHGSAGSERRHRAAGRHGSEGRSWDQPGRRRLQARLAAGRYHRHDRRLDRAPLRRVPGT